MPPECRRRQPDHAHHRQPRDRALGRAKQLLVETGIVSGPEMGPVNSVLNAAALTYVAATLQSILWLLYYVLRYTSRQRSQS